MPALGADRLTVITAPPAYAPDAELYLDGADGA